MSNETIVRNDRKVRQGYVVSDKMDKTIVVEINTLKTHSKYRKKYLSSKRYKVHDGENKHKVGDAVEFVPSRPLGKGKKFVIA